jgi:hypothetical protein
MPAASGQLRIRSGKLFEPITNRLHFFRVERKKYGEKKYAPDIEKSFNSPFQISLQGKKKQKKFFAAVIQLDRFIEWC